MGESVYKIIELVGTSPESWEKAAANAIEEASKTLDDMRVATVAEMDMLLSQGEPAVFRTKVKLSFKYHDGK